MAFHQEQKRSTENETLGRMFSASKMHLSHPVAQAFVRSKAVVLLLLIYCLM